MSSNSSISTTATATTSTTSTSSSSSSSNSQQVALIDDRFVKEVPSIPVHPLTTKELFRLPNEMPDLPLLKSHLQRQGLLTHECAHHIIQRTINVVSQEPNLVELSSPVTVCGDVHGQFFDLLKLLDVGGDPRLTQYLFLGDYVDRGLFACEVLFYLFCLKVTYPKTFWLLRGNHECRRLTEYFTFLDECTHKYDMELYNAFQRTFDNLPVAAVVTTANERFFCVHGGLSPHIRTLNDVLSLDRRQETPETGGLCDLLWSDPNVHAEEAHGGSDDDDDGNIYWYVENSKRQCSYLYGVEAVKEFLEHNDLTCIIRAHEAKAEGYQMHMVNPETNMPRVITIFSAPNYCDTYRNRGAILKFAENILNVKQFHWEEHPYLLPNFMNVFDWSLPFVSEKVIDMLVRVVEYGDPNRNKYESEEESEDDKSSEHKSDDENNNSTGSSSEKSKHGRRHRNKNKPAPKKHKRKHIRLRPNVIENRGGVLKKKILALTKMLRVYKTLRKHNEAITQLKQLCPTHRLQYGLLRSGSAEIIKALSSFKNAEKADRVNERRPSMEDIRYKSVGRRLPKPMSHHNLHEIGTNSESKSDSDD